VDAKYCAVVSSHKVSGPVITESGFVFMDMSLVASDVHPYWLVMLTLRLCEVFFLGHCTVIESLPEPDAKEPFVIVQECVVPTDATYCSVVSSHMVSGPVITESGLPWMKTFLLT